MGGQLESILERISSPFSVERTQERESVCVCVFYLRIERIIESGENRGGESVR
jgi:hypothetical protein